MAGNVLGAIRVQEETQTLQASLSPPRYFPQYGNACA
jgi:hypothetical protein